MDGDGPGHERLDEHFWLCRSVARVMGISLAERIAAGRLSPADFREMIARCRAGGCTVMCRAWLATCTDRAATAPPHCAVAGWLDRLI